MASTTAGAALTEAHRLAQRDVRAAVIRRALLGWRALDGRHLDRSWPAVREALVAIIGEGRSDAVALAQLYYTQFRVAEGVTVAATLPVMAAPPVPGGPLRATLTLLGPIRMKQATARGLSLDTVTAQAFVRLSGKASKLTTDAARAGVLDVVGTDAAARGYARVTDSDPCAFCRMLAGRGPVYGSQRTGGFVAHDHCGCVAEPVFTHDQPWPGRGRFFAEQYRQAQQKAAPGENPLNVLRRDVG